MFFFPEMAEPIYGMYGVCGPMYNYVESYTDFKTKIVSVQIAVISAAECGLWNLNATPFAT